MESNSHFWTNGTNLENESKIFNFCKNLLNAEVILSVIIANLNLEGRFDKPLQLFVLENLMSNLGFQCQTKNY